MNEFIWPVRVYYEDTDSGGVVYYANYLKFMERARTEWLRKLGFEQDELARDNGIIFVVRSVNVDYYRPARFNDLLRIHTCIAEARGASLIFEQTIRVAEDSGKPLCQGRIRVACVGVGSLKPRPIPQKVLTEIVSDN